MPALSLELEARLLAPWQAACARILGHAPRLVRGEVGPQLVFTPDDTPMYRLAIANIRVFAHARVRAHLTRLGYAWQADGTITTVPTPLALRARLRACGFRDAGYTPEIHRIRNLYMSKRTWLSRQCAGRVPVTVGTAGYYAQVAVRARLPATRHWREHLRYHLYGVQHDMTRHALMLHLVPAAAVRELGSRVQAAADAAPGLLVPEPLTRFYENDLTGYCQAIWRDLPDPAAFAATFRRPTNLAQLHAALDRRIAESRKPLLRRLLDPPANTPSFTIQPPVTAYRGIA
jgi:hypothetical protein